MCMVSKLVRKIGLDSSIWWYVLIYLILNEGETTEKGETKWDFNGGHLHARKSEDQVHLLPDLPDSSRRMLASISMLSILSVVWPELTFLLLISELFIIKAIGTSFHFHCQLPTEA